MATRIKSSQIEDGAIVAADLHSAIAINTTQSGTFGSVIVDDITLDGSSLTTSGTNNFTVDSGGLIILDADANGDIRLANSAGQYASLYNSGDHLYVKSIINEGDVYLSGKDSSGNHINALRLDMGNGGRATFVENVSVGGDLTVTGNLQVDGTQTVLNTATLEVEDKNITLAKNSASATASSGAGITVDIGTNNPVVASPQITYDATQDRWQMNKGLELLSGAPLVVGTGTTDVGRIENEAGVFSMTAYTGRQIAFGNDTNGEHVRIDADGDVGIGHDTPWTRLVVGAGTGHEVLTIYSGTSSEGQIRFADGTSGASTYQGRVEYNHTDSKLMLGAGGITPWSLDASGKVIMIHEDGSTTSTVDMLTLQATSTNTTSVGFGPAIKFQAERNNGVVQNVGKIESVAEVNSGTNISSGLAFSTGTVGVLDERVRISYDGNVGIGNDDPNHSRLYVQEDTSVTYDDTAYQHDIFLEKRNTGGDNEYTGMRFAVTGHNGSTTAEASIGIVQLDNHHAGELVFGTRNSSGNRAEKMRITSDGKIGMGTKTPSENLDIQSGTTNDHVHVVIGPSATHSTDKESHLQLWRTNSSQARTKVGELMTDIPLPAEGTRGTSLWSFQTLRLVTANSGAGHIVFAPKGTVRMRIDDAGNIGVGSVFTTTAPPDKQFHVKGAGDIKIEDNAGGSAHLHITSSTNGLKNSEWRLKTSGSNDEFYIDHMYTDNDGTSDVAVTNGQSFKITGDTHNIYNTNSQVDIRPTLNLDFTNSKSLDSRFTFLRASTATYTDSHGVIRYASHNEPRYDWDPLTGECLGLLFEEETVNHCSAHIPGSGWGQFSSHLESYSGQALAPDGTMSGVLLVEQSTEQQLMFANVGTVATGSKWTWSIYLKAGHANSDGIYMTSYGESVNATFNPSNGTSSGHSDRVMTDVGNGWYRCQLTFTKTNTNGVFYIGFDSSTRAPDYQNRNYIWGAQVENKDFATTYIRNLEKFTSRASNATYHDSTGRLVTAFRNQPRYSHRWNGAEWIPTGLLRETASTHLDGGDNTTLSNWGATNCTLSDTTATTAPDGSYTAQKYVETGSGSIIHRLAGPNFQTTDQSTVSVYLKDDGSDTNVFINAGATLGIGMLAKPSAGTILDSYEGSGTVGWFGVEYAGDGWWRYYMGAEGLNATNRVYIGSVDDDHGTAGDDYYVADGTSGFYVWGYQRENELMPTSFIYSRWAGSTTRSGDVVNYEPYYRQNDNLDMYNAKDLIGQVQGTVFTEWATKEPSTGYGGVFELQDEILGYTGIPSNGIDQRTNAYYMTGNFSLPCPQPATNTFTKTAFAYDGTSVLDSRAAKDGTLASANTVHTWNMRLTRISIGRIDINNAYILNGHIKKFRLYTDRLSDDTLKALTEND
jgi:hypothetical protein